MESTSTLSRRQLRKLHADASRAAKAISLRYVSDGEPGIKRIRTNDGFDYKLGNRKLSNKEDLKRIKALVLPPAWENVWICPHANGHLQATGTDAAGRKQYRYHADWQALRNETKFAHLCDFGKALPTIREKLAEDLSEKQLTRNKVLAAVVAIMCETGIRIGNAAYEKLYGSFGLTTLKDQHVKEKEGKVQFSFRGKKGVAQRISLRSRKLSRIVRQCRDIPGKELFQYWDEEGNHCPIDSGQVNQYIRNISGGNFSAKDFRTWTGSLQALSALREVRSFETATEAKKNIVAALDNVAETLGNTRAVCKKYYVHPEILNLYESGKLEYYFKAWDKEPDEVENNLFPNERILMRILNR